VWHNQGVSGVDPEQKGGRGRRRERPPLDAEQLRELALRYVGRFATTRRRLADYLGRKVRERGWAGDGEPDIAALVGRIAELGYVDDVAFALAKSNSLTARGYGEGRVRQALRVAGVDEQDGQAARDSAEAQAAAAALKFAKRRRIGPFAVQRSDPAGRQKALAAMVRAGHGFAIAKLVVEADPGATMTEEDLVSLAS
jgi:regulatory protein